MGKDARDGLVNFQPGSKGRDDHLAVAGVMAMVPQRALTLSNCSRKLETIALPNHVIEDKMSSRNYVGC